MIFTQKIYKRPVAEMILDGTKTCTRRLVKEGEFSMTSSGIPECNVIPMTVFKTKGLFESKRIKWQVGRDYAVQLGRGKPGLWYCLKCKEIAECKDYFTSFGKHKCKVGHKSLRIKITGIRKEALLDISLKDIKKEGFSNKDEFWKAFNSVCKPKDGGLYVNPDVWVLDFEVMK